ncbi:unnamed protein product [Rangifer tarandus platyrhynchus]|uniref:Uncharacterized protein n=2 Tax=Rangifer tarandus platyrhynchus TaxID=3082113 RepID=A0ABN8YT26_RANTA|nr:unnamed protein product [Rangifer tarandus platyrhynchus]CAI9701270.1 unnamed protein product [Rangifer tarandus platyrhynchus]
MVLLSAYRPTAGHILRLGPGLYLASSHYYEGGGEGGHRVGAKESYFPHAAPSPVVPHKPPPGPRQPRRPRGFGVTAPPSGGRGSAARPPLRPPGAARVGRGCGPNPGLIGQGPGGRGRAAAVRAAAAATAAHRAETVAAPQPGPERRSRRGPAGMVQRRLLGAHTH